MPWKKSVLIVIMISATIEIIWLSAVTTLKFKVQLMIRSMFFCDDDGYSEAKLQVLYRLLPVIDNFPDHSKEQRWIWKSNENPTSHFFADSSRTKMIRIFTEFQNTAHKKNRHHTRDEYCLKNDVIKKNKRVSDNHIRENSFSRMMTETIT